MVVKWEDTVNAKQDTIEPAVHTVHTATNTVYCTGLYSLWRRLTVCEMGLLLNY